MEIKQEWEEFIDAMRLDMERYDKQGAEILYSNLRKDCPPDKTSLVWTKAYVTLHHYASEFTRICISQARFEDAFVVAATMEALNEQLDSIKSHYRIPKEFVKEVKFK